MAAISMLASAGVESSVWGGRVVREPEPELRLGAPSAAQAPRSPLKNGRFSDSACLSGNWGNDRPQSKKMGDEGRGPGLKSDKGSNRAVQQRSGSLLRLVHSRCSHSGHRSNDGSEISRRQMNDPPLADIIESPKVTSATST